MKKLFYICTVLAIVAAFAATPADAQFPKCITFCDFCDSIEIHSITDGVIDAWWHSWDCAGSDCPMMGVVGVSAESPCTPGQICRAGIRAQAADGCPGDFWWCIDNITDGTIDMCAGTPPGGDCWIDELCVMIVDGPCDTGLDALRPDQPSLLQSLE